MISSEYDTASVTHSEAGPGLWFEAFVGIGHLTGVSVFGPAFVSRTRTTSLGDGRAGGRESSGGDRLPLPTWTD